MLGRRRRERAAAERHQEHVAAQLVAATDMAITAAVRAQLAEPVTDLHVTAPLRVTTGDVRAAAHDHFGITSMTHQEAAALLRQRLERRGHVGWGHLITNAYDDQP